MDEYERTVRLVRAAARGPEELVGALAGSTGWAAIVDPLVGAVVAVPETAGRTAERAAERPRAEVAVEEVAGVRLVAATPTAEARTTVTLAVALLEMRAARAEELRTVELRLHGVLLDLIMRGRADLAQGVADVGGRATVYRLSSPYRSAAVLDEVHRAVWRGLRPWTLARHPCVMAPYGGDLVVAVLDGADGVDGRVRALLARAAAHHGLAGGISSEVPVRMLGAGWLEAGRAVEQARAEGGGRLTPAAGLGTRSLLRVIPSSRMTAWATALVGRLPGVLRLTLGVWLETGGSSTRTAEVLALSRTTVDARLREAAAVLGADLGQACVRVRLLLGLLLDDGGDEPVEPVEPVDPATDCLAWLTDVGTARTWAQNLVGELPPERRREVMVWLEHHGSASPAAADLGVARATLARHVQDAGARLGLDLASPRTRAELYLALLTAEVTAPGAELPAGAPGHSDWRTRAQEP